MLYNVKFDIVQHQTWICSTSSLTLYKINFDVVQYPIRLCTTSNLTLYKTKLYKMKYGFVRLQSLGGMEPGRRPPEIPDGMEPRCRPSEAYPQPGVAQAQAEPANLRTGPSQAAVDSSRWPQQLARACLAPTRRSGLIPRLRGSSHWGPGPSCATPAGLSQLWLAGRRGGGLGLNPISRDSSSARAARQLRKT